MKGLDLEVFTYMELAMKIKDRDIKKEIMAEIADVKDKTA